MRLRSIQARTAAPLLASVLALALPAWAAGDSVHWAYEGAHGPEHWAGLSPDFVLCGAGVNQSPIDLVDAVDADLPPLELEYRGSTTKVINNGHTFQVDVEPGSFLKADGQRFELKQFHFHSPSEHRIGGERFALEVHFVHANEAGELAVVGVLLRLGARLAALDMIETSGPKQAGTSSPFVLALEDLGVVPVHKSYYRYNGSLTTPPCSEGVRWFVLERPRSVSKDQVETFVRLIGEDARGPQPINARLVLH